MTMKEQPEGKRVSGEWCHLTSPDRPDPAPPAGLPLDAISPRKTFVTPKVLDWYPQSLVLNHTGLEMSGVLACLPQ